MNCNDNQILRYLYGLDEKRDYPQSIKRFLSDTGSEIDGDREAAINELYRLKDNCKKLAVLSKSFVDAMDKSYMKFTQFHMDILSECDGENGVVKSPYFIDGSFVVYSIKNGSLSLWVFHNLPNRNNNLMAMPTFYIVASPKDKIQGAGHQLDCMIIKMIDGLVEVNLRDYINMVLDYLCLRQWADIEIAEIQTKQKKEVKGKKNIIIQDGISYFVLDSKWFTEVCNNNEFIVSGHFRLQPYGDGSKKLIWINEFKKHGYHRKALIEKANKGEDFLS